MRLVLEINIAKMKSVVTMRGTSLAMFNQCLYICSDIIVCVCQYFLIFTGILLKILHYLLPQNPVLKRCMNSTQTTGEGLRTVRKVTVTMILLLATRQKSGNLVLTFSQRKLHMKIHPAEQWHALLGTFQCTNNFLVFSSESPEKPLAVFEISLQKEIRSHKVK